MGDRRPERGSSRRAKAAAQPDQGRGASRAGRPAGAPAALGAALGRLREAAAAHDDELPEPGLPRITPAQ